MLYDYASSQGLASLGGLLPPSMESVEEQIAGYQLTDFQRWALDNIREMKLVKAIAENRITSTKKVPIDKFLDKAARYDDIVHEF